MEKFTKGPWAISQLSKTTVISPKELIICNANDFNGPYSEKEANMKLCSLAPEMYEALKEILKYEAILLAAVNENESMGFLKRSHVDDIISPAKSLLQKLNA